MAANSDNNSRDNDDTFDMPLGDSSRKPTLSFWERLGEEQAYKALYTPFVFAMASGKLDPADLRRHTACYAQLTEVFEHVFALVEVDIKEEESDLRGSISQLKAACAEELKFVEGQEGGLDDASAYPEATKLSRFFSETRSLAKRRAERIGTISAGKARAAYILAAVAPCLQFYTFLGARWKEVEHIIHPFNRWILNYSSTEFRTVAQKTENLLDELSFSLLPIQRIEEVYSKAAKLALHFLSAQ